ncbi:MAG TPA: GPW/gp25 family protein [Steroidobacteraceae bacterium]|nr:GPW/gp25 family protein [Steroidobacteraceae bacterium]
MAGNPEFLGKGWSFPVSFGNQGRSVSMAQAEEDIRQSLEILLSTSAGERVLRPGFGWKRDALMFEPLSTSFGAYLASEIENTILFYESRIELNRVDFDDADNQSGLILIRLDYTVRSTNTRTNLVYPFYLDHPEAKP